MAKKMTQKKAVFYMLYQAYKEDPQQYVPAWKFVGELYMPEFDEWFFMSYKTPANGVDVYHKNPELIERKQVTGKSGAKYYEYRLAPNPSIDKIIEPDIRDFYQKMKKFQRYKELKPVIPA